MAATDAACAHPRVDATRTAAMGGSFGGYMANWIAGHTNRFAAIVTHASLWALDQFGPTTDTAYYWRREMTPEMTAANSPHQFVGNISTPMLVIHGDKDYRVPIGESLRLWYELLANSALPADEDGSSPHRFLYFPTEDHWVIAPQHTKLWYEVVIAFLAEHVLGESARMAGGAGSTVAPVTATREYDIVLYGATGFVGKLTADYLARAGGKARIALAGRSTDRLRAIRDTLGESAQSWQLLTADASSPKTLDAMAAQTQVVVTTVGPYSQLRPAAGRGVRGRRHRLRRPDRRAAVRARQHRPVPQAGSGHRRTDRARVRIRFHPFGSHRLRALPPSARGRQRASSSTPTSSFARCPAGLSGGTIASGVEVLDAVSRDPDVRRQVADPYTLSPDRGAEPELGAQPDLRRRRGRQIAPELTGLWTAGFMMAPSNTRIVRRSNALQDWAYGRRFRYSEHMNVGSSALAPVVSAVVSGIGNAVSALGSRYFRLVAPQTGRSRVTQTRHRTQRSRSRARLLQGGDVHHDDLRCPLCRHHGPAGRPRLQSDRGAAG